MGLMGLMLGDMRRRLAVTSVQREHTGCECGIVLLSLGWHVRCGELQYGRVPSRLCRGMECVRRLLSVVRRRNAEQDLHSLYGGRKRRLHLRGDRRNLS